MSRSTYIGNGKVYTAGTPSGDPVMVDGVTKSVVDKRKIQLLVRYLAYDGRLFNCNKDVFSAWQDLYKEFG